MQGSLTLQITAAKICYCILPEYEKLKQNKFNSTLLKLFTRFEPVEVVLVVGPGPNPEIPFCAQPCSADTVSESQAAESQTETELQLLYQITTIWLQHVRLGLGHHDKYVDTAWQGHSEMYKMMLVNKTPFVDPSRVGVRCSLPAPVMSLMDMKLLQQYEFPSQMLRLS